MEAEHEKRVTHLQGVAARRFGQRLLARGWGGWFEQYALRQRHALLLSAVGGRLLRPRLAAAIGHWRRDWDVALRGDMKAGTADLFIKAAFCAWSTVTSSCSQLSEPYARIEQSI